MKTSTMAADEDADVFEITDFTTASEWERFVARLEEILHEWKLVSHRPRQPMTKAEQNSGTWVEKTEEVTFADYVFVITHSYLKPSVTPGQNVGHQQSPDDDIEEEEEKEDTIPTVMLDMMNTENDFPSKAHNLSRLYGLQDFVVLSPANQADPIESESRIKMVLSSISVALNNAGCPVPLFVHIKQQWRNMFTGTCLLPGATIEYDVIHLNRVPAQYNHLAGLLDVFKAKLATQVSPRPTVTVAVRFTYFLQEWVNSPWPQEPPDLSSPLEDEVGCTSFGVLPFGAEEDPVSELRLACTWPSLSEDMIVENQNYSDLDPLQAPQWSVKIIMTDDPNCLLGQYLTSFLKHCYRPESTDDLLWNFITADEENEQGADLSQALQKLTEPKVAYNIPSLSNVVNRTTTRMTVKSGEAPISGQTLNDILEFLFPDAKDAFDKPKEDNEKEEKEADATESTEQSDNRYEEVLRDLSKHLKSAPEDTLLHKLAVSLCIINIHNGGLRGVAQLWQEFVLEMRYRWENKFFIKGIHPGSPNLGSCLLYQKLQMLNCCIERKMKREQLYKGYTGDLESSQEEGQGQQSETKKQNQQSKKNKKQKLIGQRSQSDSSMEDNPSKVPHLDVYSSSEDEFFECDDESEPVKMEVDPSDKGEGSKQGEEQQQKEEGDATQKEEGAQGGDSERKTSIQEDSADSMGSSGSLVYTDSVTHKPEGRLAPFGELKLRETNEQMYIPITQEPAPMTEDMLEEQAEVLARLGTSAEGAQLRARMQSACLVSDMESFKGANPGCTIEDFVRWYSPRDWVEEEVQDENGQTVIKGHLSQRMQIPGNVWVEVWQGAKPVPARRQKRLFDDTKEAEKVLHFLASMKPASLVLHLMPVLVHAAIVKVVENEDSDIPRLKEVIDQLVNKGAKVTRAARQDVKKYEDLVRFINLAETMIARAKSLKSKFTKDLLEQKNAEQEMDSFVAELLHHQEVNVRGGPYGPAGSIIHKLFIAAQKEINMLVDDSKDEKSDDGRSSAVSDFPRPTGREYILRTFAPRPAPYSKSLPQRMYCNIMEGIEFRLAGAFSMDTTFQ